MIVERWIGIGLYRARLAWPESGQRQLVIVVEGPDIRDGAEFSRSTEDGRSAETFCADAIGYAVENIVLPAIWPLASLLAKSLDRLDATSSDDGALIAEGRGALAALGLGQ